MTNYTSYFLFWYLLAGRSRPRGEGLREWIINQRNFSHTRPGHLAGKWSKIEWMTLLFQLHVDNLFIPIVNASKWPGQSLQVPWALGGPIWRLDGVLAPWWRLAETRVGCARFSSAGVGCLPGLPTARAPLISNWLTGFCYRMAALYITRGDRCHERRIQSCGQQERSPQPMRGNSWL